MTSDYNSVMIDRNGSNNIHVVTDNCRLDNLLGLVQKFRDFERIKFDILCTFPYVQTRMSNVLFLPMLRNNRSSSINRTRNNLNLGIYMYDNSGMSPLDTSRTWHIYPPLVPCEVPLILIERSSLGMPRNTPL